MGAGPDRKGSNWRTYRVHLTLYDWQWARLKAAVELEGEDGSSYIERLIAKHIRTLPAEIAAPLPEPPPAGEDSPGADP